MLLDGDVGDLSHDGDGVLNSDVSTIGNGFPEERPANGEAHVVIVSRPGPVDPTTGVATSKHSFIVIVHASGQTTTFGAGPGGTGSSPSLGQDDLVVSEGSYGGGGATDEPYYPTDEYRVVGTISEQDVQIIRDTADDLNDREIDYGTRGNNCHNTNRHLLIPVGITLEDSDVGDTTMTDFPKDLDLD